MRADSHDGDQLAQMSRASLQDPTCFTPCRGKSLAQTRQQCNPKRPCGQLQADLPADTPVLRRLTVIVLFICTAEGVVQQHGHKKARQLTSTCLCQVSHPPGSLKRSCILSSCFVMPWRQSRLSVAPPWQGGVPLRIAFSWACCDGSGRKGGGRAALYVG